MEVKLWLWYKMAKNIAESFNTLSRANERKQRTERNVVTLG